MAVRYDGQEANTHDLQLGDTLSAPPDSGGGGVYQFGLLSDLLLWHQTYPVTAWEAARNDAVCAEQGNRNPFTDKPELVEVVFGTASAPPAATSPPPAAGAASPPPPTGQVPQPWINELHYDNSGADLNEFVEVALPVNGPAAADVSVTLYNGNGASVSWGPKSLAADFVKGATTGGVTFYHALISGIQNGAPDGVALDVGGAAVQFLSYEGVIASAVGGPADGMMSTDIGVSEGSSTSSTTSISLQGRA